MPDACVVATDFSFEENPLVGEDSDTVQEPHWSEKFRYDLYDWNDPEFVRANKGKHSYVPVPLTQGYFMMVRRADYRRITSFPNGKRKKWHVHVHRDPMGNIIRVYACRRGKTDEPKTLYAHVELKGCIYTSDIVDHMNGWGLDNRLLSNLRQTNYRENGNNTQRKRIERNKDLPTGVERRGKGYYGGIISKRFGPKRVLTLRSKRKWLTPEPARAWYLNQLKKLHKGRKSWAHNPTSVSWPLFPPLLEQEISSGSMKLRRKKGKSTETEVPF